MLIPFTVGLIAVILTCLGRNRQNGWGLKAAFGIIFVFLALRYAYGNDYGVYLQAFNDWGNFYARRSVELSEMVWEPGWVLLNLLFQPVGFFTLVMFTSLLTCVVIYRFIRNFVPVPYQWLAVFLYVFNPYQMLVTASAMRQNMTVLLFLVAIEFLYKKRLLGYFLLVAAGWTFHRSALVLIPIAALGFVNIRINKFFAVLCLLIYSSLYVFGEPIFDFVINSTGGLFERYEHYERGGGVTLATGIGLMYTIILFLSVLYFAGVEFVRSERAEHEEVLPGQDGMFPCQAARRLLFKLAILSFMFIPLGFHLSIVSRINMYFSPVLIAVYPIIAFTTKNKLYRLMFLGSLIPYTLYGYKFFFGSATWEAKFGTYQTIFSAQNWF